MDTNNGTRTPADVLGEFFPDSVEGVAVLMQAIRIGGQPVPDGEVDHRLEDMGDLMASTTPAVRTRVVVIAEVLAELARSTRAIALQIKRDLEDPDISEGSAEVTEDGWLVVTMGDKEVGRVPFNPRRVDGTEQKLATDILAEYVRLHVNGGLEAGNVTKLPVPGRVTAVAVVRDQPPTAG